VEPEKIIVLSGACGAGKNYRFIGRVWSRTENHRHPPPSGPESSAGACAPARSPCSPFIGLPVLGPAVNHLSLAVSEFRALALQPIPRLAADGWLDVYLPWLAGASCWHYYLRLNSWNYRFPIGPGPLRVVPQSRQVQRYRGLSGSNVSCAPL
jgi:hypothetical protein